METEVSPRVLTKPATNQPTPLSAEFLNAVGFQLRKLARMFRRNLDETEILTYMEGLRDLQIPRIEAACSKALLLLKQMPTLAHLREFASERSDEGRLESNQPQGKYCEHCAPDGWRLIPNGQGGKWALRCRCQGMSLAA